MKITAGLQHQLTQTPGLRRPAAEDHSPEIRKFMDETAAGEEAAAGLQDGAKILSLGEKNTLHALFGTEKPDEYDMYGRNRLQNIHKGQFLDIRA